MHHSGAFALALLLPSVVLAAPFPAGNNKVEKRCCDDAVFWECVGNTAITTPCLDVSDCAAKGNCMNVCGGGLFCSISG